MRGHQGAGDILIEAARSRHTGTVTSRGTRNPSIPIHPPSPVSQPAKPTKDQPPTGHQPANNQPPATSHKPPAYQKLDVAGDVVPRPKVLKVKVPELVPPPRATSQQTAS